MRRWFLGCLFFVALRALFSFVSSSDELPCFVYFGSRSAVRQAVYSVDAVGTGLGERLAPRYRDSHLQQS